MTFLDRSARSALGRLTNQGDDMTEPTQFPELWWSPSWQSNGYSGTDGLIHVTPIEAYRQWHGDWQPIRKVPADAVRLVAAAVPEAGDRRLEDRWALDDIAELVGFHRDAHPAEVVVAVGDRIKSLQVGQVLPPPALEYCAQEALGVSMWRWHDNWMRASNEMWEHAEEAKDAGESSRYVHSCRQRAVDYRRRTDEIGAVLRTIGVPHPGDEPIPADSSTASDRETI